MNLCPCLNRRASGLLTGLITLMEIQLCSLLRGKLLRPVAWLVIWYFIFLTRNAD